MIKVYVASPYSIGDTEENVYRNMEAGDMLIQEGFYPFIPLLMHFQDKEFPKTYDYWLDYCLEWLYCCDAVLRLDGESKGADLEVQEALNAEIPVFYNIIDLMLWANGDSSEF